MSNYATGHAAEERAARYLTRLGFKVRELNWRTKFCEIDIIAERSRCIYFVEVKYRDSSRWGSGIDYITPKKLRQMRFAAMLWMARHSWHRSSCLVALSIDGNVFRLELIDDG